MMAIHKFNIANTGKQNIGEALKPSSRFLAKSITNDRSLLAYSDPSLQNEDSERPVTQSNSNG